MPYTREVVLREAFEILWRHPLTEMVDRGLMPAEGLPVRDRLLWLTVAQILENGQVFQPGQMTIGDQRLRRLTVEQLLQSVTREQCSQPQTLEQFVQRLTPEERERLRHLLEEPTPTRLACDPPIFVPNADGSPENGNQPPTRPV